MKSCPYHAVYVLHYPSYFLITFVATFRKGNFILPFFINIDIRQCTRQSLNLQLTLDFLIRDGTIHLPPDSIRITILVLRFDLYHDY